MMQVNQINLLELKGNRQHRFDKYLSNGWKRSEVLWTLVEILLLYQHLYHNWQSNKNCNKSELQYLKKKWGGEMKKKWKGDEKTVWNCIIENRANHVYLTVNICTEIVYIRYYIDSSSFNCTYLITRQKKNSVWNLNLTRFFFSL